MRTLLIAPLFFATGFWSAAALAQKAPDAKQPSQPDHKLDAPFAPELPDRPAPDAAAPHDHASPANSAAPVNSLWHEDREVVDAHSGRLMVTVPADTGFISLTLPPGDYVVREHGQSEGKRVELRPGRGVSLDAYGIRLSARGAPRAGSDEQALPRGQIYDAEGEGPPPGQPPPPPPRQASDRFALRTVLGWTSFESSIGFPGLDFGGGTFALSFALDYSITERLHWIAPLPLFAYRIGDRAKGKVELEPWGGVTNLGYGFDPYGSAALTYAFGLGIDGRVWASRNQAWAFGLRGQTGGFVTADPNLPNQKPDTIRTVLSSAYQLKSRWVSLSLGVGAALNPLFDGHGTRWANSNDQLDFRLGFGSMQNFGPYPEPLIAFNLSPRFTLDLYSALEFSLHDGSVAGTFLVGFTWHL